MVGTERGKEKSREPMPQRKGRALELMNARRAIREIECMRAFVELEFDDMPELQEAMVACLEENLDECREEEKELLAWWSPRVAVANEARWIDGFTEDELRGCFRFGADQLRELMGLLEIPSFLWARGSTRRFRGEEAFLLLLRRLAGREKGVHHAVVFDHSPPAISEMYNAVLHHVYQHARVAMRLEMWRDDLPSFANALSACGCPIRHCFGFIDGTMFDICRPMIGQEAMYNGWKRKHKVKYQCVVLPNFMIGDWYGPATGRANDATMLDDSRLVPRLVDMRDQLGQQISLYGDAAYPSSEVLQRAPKANTTNTEELQRAERMSKYRESVEWIFGKLGELWPFVTDVTRKATGSRATAKEDCVAALLTNYHTCAYGGVANSYFGVPPPSMSEYKEMYTADIER